MANKPSSLLIAALAALTLAGCGTTAKRVTESASGKNLGLDGYVMLGEIETVNPETAAPQGKLIIGHAGRLHFNVVHSAVLVFHINIKAHTLGPEISLYGLLGLGNADFPD